MGYLLAYKTATGKPFHGVGTDLSAPEDLRAAIREFYPDLRDADFGVTLTDLDSLRVLAKDVLRENGGIDLSTLVVANSVVGLDPVTASAASIVRAATETRKLAKAAAKADAKMGQLATMTKQDFSDLTAAQKWDTVFIFMQAHLND